MAGACVLWFATVLLFVTSAAYQPQPARRVLLRSDSRWRLRSPAVQLCSEANERERAQQRKNEAALRAEWSSEESSAVDDDLKMLRERKAAGSKAPWLASAAPQTAGSWLPLTPAEIQRLCCHREAVVLDPGSNAPTDVTALAQA